MDNFFDSHEALLEARLCEKFGDDDGLDIHSFVESNIGRSNYRQRMMHCMRNMTDASLDVLADMLKSELETKQRRAMRPTVESALVKCARGSKWKKLDDTVHRTTYVVVDPEVAHLEAVDASSGGACLVDATYAFDGDGEPIPKDTTRELYKAKHLRR